MNEFNLGENKVIKSIASKLGVIICILIVLANALYNLLASMDFSIDGMLKLSAEVAIYIVSVWVLYLISVDNGVRDGKLTLTYNNAMEAYRKIRSALFCKGKELAEWCLKYVVNDLRTRKEDMLIPNDVTYELYEKSRGLSKRKMKESGLIKVQIKAIKMANKIKPDDTSAKKLLTWHDVKQNHNHVEHPAKAAAKETTLQLTKYTIFALFVVNIGFSASLTSDIKAVFMVVLLRTISLIAVLFNGYRAGYKNQTITAVNYTNDQTEKLTMFSQEKAPT